MRYLLILIAVCFMVGSVGCAATTSDITSQPQKQLVYKWYQVTEKIQEESPTEDGEVACTLGKTATEIFGLPKDKTPYTPEAALDANKKAKDETSGGLWISLIIGGLMYLIGKKAPPGMVTTVVSFVGKKVKEAYMKKGKKAKKGKK